MLNGSAAAEAVGVYMKLEGQSFNGDRVALAVRTRSTRRRILGALTPSQRFSGLLRPFRKPRAARAFRALRAAVRGSRAVAAAPARPRRGRYAD